jgi:hypothetical protein
MRIHIFTGDNHSTALSIANAVGIPEKVVDVGGGVCSPALTRVLCLCVRACVRVCVCVCVPECGVTSATGAEVQPRHAAAAGGRGGPDGRRRSVLPPIFAGCHSSPRVNVTLPLISPRQRNRHQRQSCLGASQCRCRYRVLCPGCHGRRRHCADEELAVGFGSGHRLVREGALSLSVADAAYRCLQTFARIRLNFLFAFVYNIIGVPLAAGALYPLLAPLAMPPAVCALAMALSSTTVVLSSLLLKRYQPPKST